MVPMSPPLRAQLLRPRCCRCEVSSGGGHCSSPRFVNIGFSTSQAHNLSISKSCSSCVCSVVADSQLPSTRSGENEDEDDNDNGDDVDDGAGKLSNPIW
ncbi:hypothetical protein DY000_02004068 [Brassica cretica]|uniref:Uncharacterized protein n=1 Tax=Brassica cretica TaxID=69181 RepID=A0ABQ7C0D9_BRACR|nr:hypothetical protein DY000_02004068 [Brassica cretica]